MFKLRIIKIYFSRKKNFFCLKKEYYKKKKNWVLLLKLSFFFKKKDVEERMSEMAIRKSELNQLISKLKGIE